VRQLFLRALAEKWARGEIQAVFLRRRERTVWFLEVDGRRGGGWLGQNAPGSGLQRERQPVCVIARRPIHFFDQRDGGLPAIVCWLASLQAIIPGNTRMAEGTIKKLTDKGFGFISTGKDKDLFFHSESVQGVSFSELREGQKVSFTEGRGPKGPRAENVTPV
jgi:CspA family cold shock protein